MCAEPACGSETTGTVVVVVWRVVFAFVFTFDFTVVVVCDRTVVLVCEVAWCCEPVAAAGGWCGGTECDPNTRRRTMTRLTAATAAAGAANRRGRRLMPCIALSSRQSLPGAVTGVLTTVPASSKVTGRSGSVTGGSGTGGTTGFTRLGQADGGMGRHLDGALGVGGAGLGIGVGAQHLQGVQLTVIALHRMDVVMRASPEGDGSCHHRHHPNQDEPRHQHRHLFNRMRCTWLDAAAPSRVESPLRPAP